METILLFVVLLGIFYLAYKVYRIENRKVVPQEEIERSLEKSLKDADFYEDIGKITSYTEDIREIHQDVSSMLESPKERGSFGEQQLELILQDMLPSDMYGIREEVIDNKIPDAYIETSGGIICIDSKFPLENYRRMLDCNDETERKSYADNFRRDVERHLRKIKNDYLRPNKGTLNVSFAFVPSESVYYYLVTEEFDMVKNFSSKGVQVVSPLTVGHKMQLIKADVKTQKLSEKAESVKRNLENISESIEKFEDEWSTLKRHVSNAEKKSGDVDREFNRLVDKFDSVSDFQED